MQLLWEAIWYYQRMLKVRTSYNPEITLWSVHLSVERYDLRNVSWDVTATLSWMPWVLPVIPTLGGRGGRIVVTLVTE